MVLRDIHLHVPEALAREAEDEGLLTPQAIESMLRKALTRQRRQSQWEEVARARAAELPPMSMEEIQQEIDEVRAARRQNHARHT